MNLTPVLCGPDQTDWVYTNKEIKEERGAQKTVFLPCLRVCPSFKNTLRELLFREGTGGGRKRREGGRKRRGEEEEGGREEEEGGGRGGRLFEHLFSLWECSSDPSVTFCFNTKHPSAGDYNCSEASIQTLHHSSSSSLPPSLLFLPPPSLPSSLPPPLICQGHKQTGSQPPPADAPLCDVRLKKKFCFSSVQKLNVEICHRVQELQAL